MIEGGADELARLHKAARIVAGRCEIGEPVCRPNGTVLVQPRHRAGELSYTEIFDADWHDYAVGQAALKGV